MRRNSATLALVSVMCALCLATTGCDKDATELSKEGNVHLLQKNYPQAIAAFDAALKLEPEKFEASVGLAEAYTEQGEHPKAHEYFDKVYASQLDKGRQLYVDTKFQSLLLAEAEALEDKNSDAYEVALRKVIDKRKRGQSADKAYELLAGFYIVRADELAKNKKTRVQAAEAYEKMRTVKTTRELRRQALDKAEALYRAAYKDSFAERLAAEKASWGQDSPLSAKDGRLVVVAMVEDKRLRFKTDEDKVPYQRKLTQQAQREIILAMHRFSDTTPPQPLRRHKLTTATLDSQVYGKGKASVTMSVTLEELEDVSYARLVKPARKAARKAQGKKSGAKPADGAAKPADGAAKPADGAAKPADGAAKPADGAAKPADGAAKPVDGAAKPVDGAAKPVDGAAKPPDGAK